MHSLCLFLVLLFQLNGGLGAISPSCQSTSLCCVGQHHTLLSSTHLVVHLLIGVHKHRRPCYRDAFLQVAECVRKADTVGTQGYMHATRCLLLHTYQRSVLGICLNLLHLTYHLQTSDQPGTQKIPTPKIYINMDTKK